MTILIFLFLAVFFVRTAFSLPECKGGEKNQFNWASCTGKLTFSNGAILVADFSYSGNPAIGKMTWADGDYYIGQFRMETKGGTNTYYRHGLGLYWNNKNYRSTSGRWHKGKIAKVYQYYPYGAFPIGSGKGWDCFSPYVDAGKKCVEWYSLEGLKIVNLKFLRSLNLI